MNDITAKWIWGRQENYREYNSAIVARKKFVFKNCKTASLKITADSYYRLIINSQIVLDGPCKSWPTDYKFDELDVSEFLRNGENNIEIVVRYFGVGDFRGRWQHPGLLFQLDLTGFNGEEKRIVSDDSWLIAKAVFFRQKTPKISIQMEPAELYDSRKEATLRFDKAVCLYDINDAPWKNLGARDVPLLSRIDKYPQAYKGAKIVKPTGKSLCFSGAMLLYSEVIEANRSTSLCYGLATRVVLNSNEDIKVLSADFIVKLIPLESKSVVYKNEYLLLLFNKEPFNHKKDQNVSFESTESLRFLSPLDESKVMDWLLLRLPDFELLKNDLDSKYDLQKNITKKYHKAVREILSKVEDSSDLLNITEVRIERKSGLDIILDDFHWDFENKVCLGEASSLVTKQDDIKDMKFESCRVKRSELGDIELQYDFGDQVWGYYYFEIYCDEGTIVDIASIEYIDKDKGIQYTKKNRNSLRYIAKEGLNKFTSFKRRSGRYVFLTIRDNISPVEIREFKVIESTYPFEQKADFKCSDSELEKIWEMSCNTLRLCIDDTFVDCPLYEQVMWVGDARNASLFAYNLIGGKDVAKRCIRLAAESLKYYPFVGSQVPTSWDCLIPAWSFLWVISVWEYYWYSADKGFLEEIWDDVIKNIKGIKRFLNKDGLFSGPFWNFFDWADIGTLNETTLYNNMLLAGALTSARACSEILRDDGNGKWLENFREKLICRINSCWDISFNAYPDFMDENGIGSKSYSQHTSILSYLYEIVALENKSIVVDHLLEAPENMTRIGSPFALTFLYEALYKAGYRKEIIESVRELYRPMLEKGSTTLWERFPGPFSGGDGDFPTRSHCHVWSASPLQFFPSVILGIQQKAAGGLEYTISPVVIDLVWAKGKVMTNNGVLAVDWCVDDNEFMLRYSAPDGVKIDFVTNDSLKGKKLKILSE